MAQHLSTLMRDLASSSDRYYYYHSYYYHHHSYYYHHYHCSSSSSSSSSASRPALYVIDTFGPLRPKVYAKEEVRLSTQ